MSEQTYEDVDEFLDDADDIAVPAFGIASGAGALSIGTTAAGGGILGAAEAAAVVGAGAAGAAVAVAAAAGVGIGMAIEYATDGAISDAGSDLLLGLVGGEESYKAAMAFDDGDIFEGLGHMAVGAGGTIADAASDLAGGALDLASDGLDAVGDLADDAWDAVTDIF